MSVESETNGAARGSCDISERKKGKKQAGGDEEAESVEQCSDVDMDTDDYEYLRSSTLRDLIELEGQFHNLRDALYQERTQQINRRLAELNEGCAVDYRRKVAALEESFRNRLEVAGIQKQLQCDELEKAYEGARISANRDFDSDRMDLFDRLKEDLEGKIAKLKADKQAADVNLAMWMLDSADRFSLDSKKKKEGREGKKKTKRPVTVSGPYIVYMLREEEIQEDHDAIRRAAIEKDLYEHQLLVSPS